MAYPDLYKDETKILEAQNIKVKSVSFEAVLTSRRLILLDSKKQMMPAQEILLATLKNVDSGENAIRDPTITLSIITNSGTTRQMILTFSKTSGGERKRECDEWVKALRQNVSQPFAHPILPDIPTLAEEEQISAPESLPVSPPPQPRIEIVNAPPQKKRIEISRPMKKIIESEPAMPKPVETSSLPTGSFCNRCGSRVPPESAFCNRCGTPVVRESDLEAALEQRVHTPPVQPPPVVPQPVHAEPVHTVVESPVVQAEPYFPEPESTIPEIPSPAPEPAPAVPQVAVPLPPVFGNAADKKERPIEEVIHSIEPLIEDSVPRTEPAPLVPRPASYHAPEPPVAEPPKGPEIQWPVITPSAPLPGSSPDEPGNIGTPVPAATPPGKGRIIAIGAIVLVIIAVIAGVFIFANPLQMINSVPTPAPTPVQTIVTGTPVAAMTTVIPVTTTISETTPATTSAPVTTPSVTAVPATSTIPPTGVWVRVAYINQFSGQVGTPNAQRDVSDTGEKLYQVSTSTGTVIANIQKVDGSADPLTVIVYKDGGEVIKKTTIAPKGMVEIQVSLKPAPTPTPTFTLVVPPPTTAPAINGTANATAGE